MGVLAKITVPQMTAGELAGHGGPETQENFHNAGQGPVELAPHLAITDAALTMAHWKETVVGVTGFLDPGLHWCIPEIGKLLTGILKTLSDKRIK